MAVKIPLGAHGGDVYSLAGAMGLRPGDMLDFSGNANIFAHGLTQRLVSQTPYSFLHYPDSNCAELTRAIAAHEGLPAENILAGNGGADLIWLAMRGLAPRKVLCVGPIFSEYAQACLAMGVSLDVLPGRPDLDFNLEPEDLRRIWESDADLVVLCAPNNPAGTSYPNIQAFFEVLRAPRLLVDACCREFLYGLPEYAETGYKFCRRLARQGVSVLCLSSFTQFFCCPGIRLGYITGEANQLGRLARQSPPWSVSAFAQDMGRLFLENIEDYRQTLTPLRRARRLMRRELLHLGLFDPDLVFDGPGFLCCGLPQPLARQNGTAALRAFLLERRILARNCDNIPGLPPGFIRLNVRPEEDLEKLLSALRRWTG